MWKLSGAGAAGVIAQLSGSVPDETEVTMAALTTPVYLKRRPAATLS